ncbi:MAG: class I SAM-dependent methyltransferase [Asgard group archaeon]|nr:class I SAM-dependent methyltransferase [Asgard group archaeon]
MTDNNKKKQSKEPISNYDEIAESFSSKRSYPWTEVIDFVNSLPKEFNRVLDLGCGNGRHSRVVLEKSFETFASDISYKILSVAKNTHLKENYSSLSGLINADALDLPFRLNTFDCIIVIAVIHHLDTHKKRMRILHEIYRTLKQNGIAFICCWMREHPRFSREDLSESVTKGEKDILVPWTLPTGEKLMRYYYLFDQEELHDMVKQIGFNIKQSFTSNDNLFLELVK